MFTKRWERLETALLAQSSLLDSVERHCDRMETILMVREPSTVAAAEAYDGLRKQVVGAVSERLAHLSQLAQFDEAVSHGADPPTLAAMLDGWLEQAGLERVTDPAHPRADVVFQLVEDLGGPLEVLAPAYVDSATHRIVRQGRARRSTSATSGSGGE